MFEKLVPDSKHRVSDAEKFLLITRMYIDETLNIKTILHMEDSLNQTFKESEIDFPLRWIVRGEFELVYHQGKVKVFRHNAAKKIPREEILQH